MVDKTNAFTSSILLAIASSHHLSNWSIGKAPQVASSKEAN